MRIVAILLLVTTPLCAREASRVDLEMSAMQQAVAEHAMTSADPIKKFLGAKLLLSLPDSERPAAPSARAVSLEEQLAAQVARDPLILRLRMVDARDHNERRTLAYELAQVDPDSLIAWLEQLPEVSEANLADAERLIGRAAVARRAGSDFGLMVRAIGQLWREANLPEPSAELQQQLQADGHGSDWRDLGMVIGFAFDAAVSLPLQPVARWCGKDAPWPPASCGLLLDRMASEGTDQIVVNFAASLGYRRAVTAAERRVWAERVRTIEWQDQAYSTTVDDIAIRDEALRHWMKEGATERDVMNAVFRLANLPSSPPESFVSERVLHLESQARRD